MKVEKTSIDIALIVDAKWRDDMSKIKLNELLIIMLINRDHVKKISEYGHSLSAGQSNIPVKYPDQLRVICSESRLGGKKITAYLYKGKIFIEERHKVGQSTIIQWFKGYNTCYSKFNIRKTINELFEVHNG